MENSTRELIEFNQGWEYMEKGITKLKRILQGLPEPEFSSKDYMSLYTTVYGMCTQKPPHDYSQQLYDKYREVFLDYLTSTVLPSLENTQHADEKCWLRDIVKVWKNHKIMVRWLSRFFHYLDRLFVCQRALPSTNAVGMICFRELVYGNVKGKVRDVVISLIGIEREGEVIDQDLVKNAIDMFVEMGVGQLKCYKDDFEVAILDDTSTYYSRKASNWIVEDSAQEYMLKAEECLKQEKIRCGNYLHASSEKKLLDKVQNAFASKLLEKGDSGGLEETRQKINKLHLDAGESVDT